MLPNYRPGRDKGSTLEALFEFLASSHSSVGQVAIVTVGDSVLNRGIAAQLAKAGSSVVGSHQATPRLVRPPRRTLYERVGERARAGQLLQRRRLAAIGDRRLDVQLLLAGWLMIRRLTRQ
jgi:hypothetical protein